MGEIEKAYREWANSGDNTPEARPRIHRAFRAGYLAALSRAEAALRELAVSTDPTDMAAGGIIDRCADAVAALKKWRESQKGSHE